jgi:O-acetyl-ADP-ribose deacetylase (regulator of RNase III)
MLGIRKYHKVAIDLYLGDITTFACDVMVNAANSALMGGGGVDGAIHRAGGPSIMEETRQKYPAGCPTGNSVVSSAGALPAQWLVHAVGPIWRGGGEREAEQLAAAYHSCLLHAEALGARHIAFPSISTGAYRFPLEEASKIAMNTVKMFIESRKTEHVGRITFVLFNHEHYTVFQRALFATFIEEES